MRTLLNDLITAGHAKATRGIITETITAPGQYKATNGYWYDVHFNGAGAQVSSIGYSEQFVNERDQLAYRNIQDCPEQDAKFEAAIRQALSI